ncbi:MAG TPA: hypothetical protein VEV42_11850 [Pyrinomonadaceae bacterium]|jgi:hypothetical protein|nr:hypothetical protein [Pyrinomonadaceae bacterium]
MINVHRIVKCTTVTLLAALGFVMIVWAHDKPAPIPDTVRAVKLRLTFESGDWANVTEVEGGTINIEKNGKKLSIIPYLRDQGQVELRIFNAVQREGKETMEAAGTLLVGKAPTKLQGSGLLTGVQVLDSNKRLSPDTIAVAGGFGTCCVSTCAGTQVCGVCVCTDCGRCGPGWCDCAAPIDP